MNPTRLGRYEVLGLLGQGAMGAVYRARDPALDRTVAIKTLSPVLLAVSDDRDEYVERLRREARAAGRLSHPHIVSVYDLGLDESGSPFIVMEYVPGASLAAVLKENPLLPVSQAIETIEQVGAALAEAHRHGIVHRDIKPANVFLDARGRVKVGDFGIARIEGSNLTRTGVGLGTPGYLAPEVMRGGRADARSDVFSLGALAYQLLTGKRPFGTTTADLAAMLEREPAAPHTVRPGVPEPASSAVMRALAKSPAARTPTVAAFLGDLRAEGPTEPTRKAWPPPPAAKRRRPVLLYVAVTVGALGLALAVFFLARGTTRGTTVAGTPPPRPRSTSPAVPATARPTAVTPLPSPPRPEPPPPPSEKTREERKKEEERAREEEKRLEEEAREEGNQAREEARKEGQKKKKGGKKGRGKP
jgi:serine/threonine-protein kinase